MTATALLFLATAFAGDALADTDSETQATVPPAASQTPAPTPVAMQTSTPETETPTATWDVDPTPKKRVSPEVPRKRRGDGVHCVAEVGVDERGRASEISFPSCPDDFHDNVTAALMQWRWTPATRGDEPVASTYTVGLQFP